MSESQLPVPNHQLLTIGNLTVDDIVLHSQRRMYLESSGGDALFSAIGAWIWHRPVGLIARSGAQYSSENIRRIEAAGIICHLRRVPNKDICNWVLYEPDGSRQFVNQLGSGTYQQMSITGEEIPPECLDAGAYHIAPMPVDVRRGVVSTLRQQSTVPGRRLEQERGEMEKPSPLPLSQREREKSDSLPASTPPPASPKIQKPDFRRGEYPLPTSLISLDLFPQHLDSDLAIQTALRMLPQVDLFLPSSVEAAILYGSNDLKAAARVFASLGAPVVCIKMGIEGSLLYLAEQDHFYHIPICRAETVDPTGAGDAFCGGFLAGLLHSGDPLSAACCGAVSASYVVQTVGALSVLEMDFSNRDERLRQLQDKC